MDQAIYGKALGIVKSLYGENEDFREGQYEAIEAVLTHKRTLIVQKTGWGKSLVYFVCTKLLRESGKGLTIVVSPLIALMENQRRAAQSLGLSCEIVNSTTNDIRAEQIAAMKAGTVDLVLTTPEKLFSKEMEDVRESVDIGLFVIDEAHCISDWGYDFRLEYSRLNRVINTMPKTVPVLGTTATANDRVVEDLKKQFGDDVYISRGPLMRKSLYIQILHLATPAERYAWMAQNIPKLPGSGIVYCLTQRDCDNIADYLKRCGVSALSYHSGKDAEETDAAETELRENNIKVLVATVKLGMGYDKGDIAFVIHYQQPSNIVAYYQQIGRAGRNIDRAYTFLMCGNEDTQIQDYFIETAFPTEEEAKAVYDAVFSHSEEGISTVSVGKYVDIRRNRSDKALMFLENEGMVIKERSRYYPTAKPFVYNREHYESIKSVRHEEQRQMLEFTKLHGSDKCLSRFVVNCLDDPTTEKCGICPNCTGKALFPEKVSEGYLTAAQRFLKSVIIPITPRLQWPDKTFTGSKNIEPLNHEGICLSKYGDPGYGTLVRKGKYSEPAGFGAELVKRSVQVLRPVVEQHGITAVTCVPSNRSRIVQDFAEKTAEGLGIPFTELLAKRGTTQQKEKENSFFQCDNAYTSFALKDGIGDVPEKVILIDDIVDSKWTITVCGYLLSKAGCQLVFPFALADSSENKGGTD